MNNYKWNIKELKELRNTLKLSLLCNKFSDNEINNIMINIEVIETMLHHNKFQASIFKLFDENFSFKIKFDIKEFKECKNFFSTPFQIDTIINHNNLLKGYNYILKDYKNITDNMDFDFQKKLTIENYLSIFGLEKDINFLLDPNNNRLNLVKYKDNNTTYSIGDKAYIILSDKKNIYSYLSLNHEIGHFYELSLPEKITYENNEHLYNYREISSLFLELISIYKLLKENLIDKEKFKNLHLDIMTDNLNIYNFMNAFYISTNDKPNFIDKFKMHFYSSSLNEIIYYYSFLIALNLYYQYLDNPIEAVKNLKHILININDNNEEKILKEAQIDLNGNCIKKHIEIIK